MPNFPIELREREEKLGDYTVRVISYQLANDFICTVDNIDPGGVIAHSRATTREAAERAALDKALDAMP